MANNNIKLANEWFKKAKADIDFAKIGIKETQHYGQVCFLCQQAAENPVIIGLTWKKEDAQEALNILSKIIKLVEKSI